MTTQSEATDAYADTTRYHRSWYWYDWANSAFVTTVGTVLFGPYLTTVAKEAACPGIADDATCTTNLYVVPAAANLPGWVSGVAMAAAVLLLLGLVLSLVAYARDTVLPYRPSALVVPLALATVVLVLTAPLDPGSVAPYTITLATIVSAVLLVFVGAITDRTPRPARLLGIFAWVGSAAGVLLFFLSGSNWRFGAAMMIIASISLGASLVVYDAILCRIARPDDRDRVSSRGWALGYLGGGLLLAANLVIVSKPDLIGVSTGMAVRVSLLSAGLWWAGFTLIPVIGMWNLRGRRGPGVGRTAGRHRRAAASPSSATPSATCAPTRTRCCSCSPTCSSTTGSRRSSPRAASTAPSS